MRKLILPLCLLCLHVYTYAQSCPTGLSGTLKIGPSGNYPTLTVALSALRTAGLSGPVILELKANYTATGESFPLLFGGISCLSVGNTLTLRPETGATNLVISSVSSSVFSINNARYVTIDGRPGGQGNTSQLKIASTNQSTPVIQFTDDASYNRLMYMHIEGTNTNAQGNVFFGSSTQNITNGNNFNEISYCKITVPAFSPNQNAIYSAGTQGKKNRGNSIRYCELYNFVLSGVALEANNEAWKIDSNHFYGRQWRKAAILVNDTMSSGFQIHGNFIGGSAPQCGGAALAFTDLFRGILLYTSNNGYTSIQDNTIANIDVTDESGRNFVGIHMATGKFRCGDIKGNTIGSESNLRSITYNTTSIFYDDFTLYGILACGESYYGNADTVFIRNNKVCGIFAQRAAGPNVIGHGKIVGIGVTEQARGFVEISANTIGHTSRYSSIQNIAGAEVNLIVGIDLSHPLHNGETTSTLIQNNLIANLNGNCTGINVIVAKAVVRNNTIRNMYATFHATDNGGVVGINLGTAKDSCVVSGNTIHSFYAKDQSPVLYGINTGHSSNLFIEKNNIHSLQAVATTSVAHFYGIKIEYSSGNVIRNNMIRLGIDSAGNGITGDHRFEGISISGTNTTTSHNSVYIGGSSTNNNAFNSYAFVCTGHPQIVTGNIFFNAHSSPSGGLSRNYAFFYSGDSIGRVYTNYNIYYAAGNQTYLAGYWQNYTTYEATTIDQWRTLAKKDSNSMAYNPNFKNPTGNVNTGDLHLANPTPAEGQGAFDPLLIEDFDGDLRSNFSPTDIGADAGNFTLQDGDAPVLTHAAFLGHAITDAEIYSVRITDNGGGVDTSGTNKPRMWYRKKYSTTSNWVSVPGVLQSGTPQGGEWGFAPNLALTGASFNPGDSLEYYFVAQDKGPVINLGYSNKGGTVHTSVTAQTSAPATPLKLLLMGYFADTVYVGNGQTYTSLTSNGGFFEASNKMKFQPTTAHPVVYITSDLLAETGVHGYKNLSPTRNKVKMQTPDAVVKKIQNSGNLTETLIRLYNVHDFIIDGSVNGNGRFLLFSNGSTTPNYNTGVVSIHAPDSLRIQNCIFESNMNQVYGAVMYAYTSQAKGLQIVGNLFQNIETGPRAGLPMTGLALNIGYGDTVIIRKNEFANFGTTGLSITQPVSAPTVRHLIDSNHFYHNSTITSVGSRTAILYKVGLPSIITNNFVGGSAPFCGGSPWTFPTQVSGSVAFKGIELSVGKEGIHLVRNNVVRNIHITGFGYMLYGIYHQGDGSLRLEDNMIGDTTTDSSLVNKAFICGIYCLSTSSTSHSPEVQARGNLVAGITAPTVTGLEISAPKGTVQDNKVTRIRTKGFATGIAGYKGLRIGINNGSLVDNEVSDLVCLNAPGWTYGIEVSGGIPLPNEMVIERNRISRLQTNGGANSPISGIYMGNGQYKVRNNAISLTNGPVPSGAPLYGLHFQGSAGNVFRNEIAYNTVYIGGESNNAVRSAGLFVDGGSPIARLRNNLLYNERSGTGTHVALAVLPLSGTSAWTSPNISNHNFYVTRDTTIVNEWKNNGPMSIGTWRSAVRGDSASYASIAQNVPSSTFFANAIGGDLHINNNDTLCWYVNGKGLPLTGISGDMDTASGVRSTGLATGATDIGADEFTTTSKPPVLLVTGRHMPNGVDTLSMNGKVVATIQWGSSGTIPTLGDARYYSGVWPNDTTNNGSALSARFFNAYWDIPATGGNGYTYSLTLHYDSSIVGKVTDLKKIIVNKRQSAMQGSWTELHPNIIDTGAKTITVHNLTSFSEFTATDSLASLALGAPMPDLTLSAHHVSPTSIATGASFTASVTESNIGTGMAGDHKIRFYLSADNVLTPGANGDTLLGSHNVASLMGGTNTGNISKSLGMPCIATGTYYLFFIADDLQQVPESNETNNAALVSITVTTGATLTQPTITATPSATVCNGTQVTLTANAANCTNCTYTWSNNANTQSITVSNSGTYTVTVSNVCGTTSTSQVVTISSPPTVTIVPSLTTICLGWAVNLTASGAATYSWTGPGLSATSGSSVIATPTTAGTHQYTVTGTSNGCSQTQTVSITVAANPVLSISPGDTTICAGGSATLAASGAAVYSWSPATGLNTASGATVVATPATTTTYTVTGYTSNGCTASMNRTITVLPTVLPSVSISYSGCPNNSLVFTAIPVNGGSNPQYQWYVDNVLQSSTGNALTLNNASNGSQVYVKMTSSAVCPSVQTVNSATTTVNCITTAVPSINGLEKFVVAPNPTKGKLVLQLKLLQQKEVSLKVTNMNGKNIYVSGTMKLSGDVNKVIDLSGAATGAYYLIVTIGQKQFTEKIIVAR